MKHKLQLKNLALILVLALTLVAGALPGVAQKADASQYPSETFVTNTGAHSYSGEHFTIDNGEEEADGWGITGKNAPITITAKNNEIIKNVIITSGLASDLPVALINANPSTSVTSKGYTIRVEGVNSTSFNLKCNAEGAYFEKFVIQYEEAPVTVKVDVGAGHESLLGGEMLDYIAYKMELKSATMDGSIVTLVGVNPEEYESDIQGAIWENIFSLTDYGMHNGEMFYNVGYKSFDKYATSQEFDEDTYAEEHYLTPISDGKTYYALWRKPLDKLELGTGDPVCGKATEDVKPTVPEGVKINFSRWYEGKAYIERFEGGKEYTGFIVPKIDIEGVLWKYFIDPEKTEVSVKGGKEVKKVEGEDFAVSFKATADHDWDEGTVTKEPTETADGVKTFKCKHCDATKTEAIPKKGSQTNAPKVTTIAKTSARAMTVKWTMKWGKVSGTKSYKVAYRKVGSKKWTYKTTKKTKYVVKGHKLKGLYEYKVAAISKKGTTWSGTSRRYFSGVKTKAKAGKGSIKVSWKKDKTATGYQVFVATNKKMKNSKKFEVGKSAKSYKIKGLKKGKRYYVRVRPMKTHGGVTYKGILSKTKSVRVK